MSPAATRPLVVVALGGNALWRAGGGSESKRSDGERSNGERTEELVDPAALHRSAEMLAELAVDHALVVTHGNGPQVGALASRAGGGVPFDVLGAETEGWLGYRIEAAVADALAARGVSRPLCTVVTQVRVEAADPARTRPTKAVGPWLDPGPPQDEAERRGWATITGRDGRRRRVVPSPRPIEVLESAAIGLLVTAGVVVVCAGGGGVPVVVEHGRRTGVDGVVDKDLTASLLAVELGAERLVILTDVAGVARSWPDDGGEIIGRTAPSELRRLAFEAGTMGPKVDAVCRFVEATGRPAMIGALADAGRVARGEAGTVVLPDA